jgi:hypothetical protein
MDTLDAILDMIELAQRHDDERKRDVKLAEVNGCCLVTCVAEGLALLVLTGHGPVCLRSTCQRSGVARNLVFTRQSLMSSMAIQMRTDRGHC